MSTIDYSWRPEDYSEPFDPEELMLSRISGAARREVVRKMIEEGGTDAVPEGLEMATLSHDERRTLGLFHPSFLGGEYLPPCREYEVEIARVTIRSTTYDVVSVRAKYGKNRISYRINDEYNGDNLGEKHTRTSIRPLTLGSLLDFLTGAWSLYESVEYNYPDDLEGQLGFFWGESLHYPDFDEALREQVTERFYQTAGKTEQS
ncbi:hypothetical protein C8D99_1202 [Aminivibrio pyruvatiphilus]|uniref:Uncharacterized protein n=1 Tax=Aminivibrio pyruvatiphilus TaxID=1005740 RepID=A0A4R8M4Y6_9BACT|nr:hypothetical protein [Aminivibrio pyruvatiphilus]TDY55921.1 hypothetical protein C8D99_1202 [Aminivibrio pyruvatiphilus]